MKFICVTLALFVALAAAQSNSSTSSNSTVIPVIPTILPSLVEDLATCPIRDQILRLNQLAAVEYLNRAYFIELNNNFGAINASASALALGLPSGWTVSEVQSNLTLIVNQLNIVISYFNSTIPSWCSELTSDDQMDCYVYAPCSNYTFGNLSDWHTTLPSNNKTNSSTSSNSSTPSNSTSSNLPSSSVVKTAVSQGAGFSNSLVNFIIGSVPLFSNDTLQLQLQQFEAMHAQQAAYLDILSGSSPVVPPLILTNSNTNIFSRSNIMSHFVSFVSNAKCCDGWRNVRAT